MKDATQLLYIALAFIIGLGLGLYMTRGVTSNPVELAIVDVDETIAAGLEEQVGAFAFSVVQKTNTASVEIFSVNDDIPTHYHPQENHILYITNGRATGKVNDVVAELAPGMLVFIPKGAPHSLDIIEAPFEFVLFSTPPFDPDDIVWVNETKEEKPSVTIEKTTSLQFVNHLQANLPEQDVFVLSNETDKVVRVEGNATPYLGQDVYAARETVDHDPFKVGDNPLGPYPKGNPLGFTLGEWLAATGKGEYKVFSDNTAELDLSFNNLIPNGVYTVWCSRIKFPPNPSVVDKPCGAPDGSENVFTADRAGNGAFRLGLNPLEPSTTEVASVIALAYHSDGKTYGANPGDFGLKSHVHIFVLLPAE